MCCRESRIGPGRLTDWLGQTSSPGRRAPEIRLSSGARMCPFLPVVFAVPSALYLQDNILQMLVPAFPFAFVSQHSTTPNVSLALLVDESGERATVSLLLLPSIVARRLSPSACSFGFPMSRLGGGHRVPALLKFPCRGQEKTIRPTSKLFGCVSM